MIVVGRLGILATVKSKGILATVKRKGILATVKRKGILVTVKKWEEHLMQSIQGNCSHNPEN